MSKRSGGPQTSTKTSPGRADHRSQDAVILNTIAVLNAAKDAVGNIQVPGLSEVFITAKFLLETLQLVRSTTQDVCDTVESIESLTVLLKSTIDKINEKTTTSDDEARKVIDEIEHSEDLKDRISGLQGALEGIKSSAKLLVHEHWYSRYWYARRDAKTLTDIRTKIATAKEQFKMRGDIDMHILIDRLAGDAHRSLEEARKTNTLLKVIDSREQQREHKEREREERETLKKLRRAPDALYKSARQSAKARIVSGTRERTLGTLLEWCKAPTQSQRVFILHAPPGTGKSIIMHEVARQLLETHLGATFFFQRDEDECCDPNRVIPTIVHQLARITELRPSIVKAVERYLDECGDEDQVLQGQRALLMDPLSQNFNKDTPIAILVDGLEGCSDKDPEALQMLLQLLFEVADRNPVVRLLISTSLEDRIKSALDSITTRDASLWLDLQNDVSPAEIQHDISLFIETELKRGMAGSDKFTLLRDRPDALTNLTNLSSGLFIFARVVVMCLTGDAVKAPGYYDALLNAKNATTSVHMQDKVDVVYKVVLRSACQYYLKHSNQSDTVKMVRRVLILAGDYFSVSKIKDFVDSEFQSGEGDTALPVRPPLKEYSKFLNLALLRHDEEFGSDQSRTERALDVDQSELPSTLAGSDGLQEFDSSNGKSSSLIRTKQVGTAISLTTPKINTTRRDRLEMYCVRIKAARESSRVYKHLLAQIDFLTKAYAQDYANQVSRGPPRTYDIEYVLRWYQRVCDLVEQIVDLGAVTALAQYLSVKDALEELYVDRPRELQAYGETHLLEYSKSPGYYSDIVDALQFSTDAANEILELKGAQATSVVEFLDQVLYALQEHSLWSTADTVLPNSHDRDSLMCSSLDMLRTLCSRNSIVPSSYILPHEQNLQRTGDEPKAQGSFADVWQGSHRGRTVALKVFRDPNSGESNGYERKTKEDFYKEAVVWKRLRHSNITQFYGINTTAFPLCLVCEWMPHGTIAQYLFQEPQAYRLVLMIDIAEGMNYLHENKIVHGSLNSANILINDDCQACLCDFGLATLSYAGKPNMSPQDSDGSGPLRWEAPERIDPKRIGVEKPMLSFQSDVYSFAMVTWEVFTGRIPFHDIRSDIQVVSSIMRGVRPHRPRQATWFGLVDEVWDIMEDSWHDDPDKRPQSHRILARLKDVVDWLDRSVLEPPQQWPLEVYQTRTS